MEIYHESLYQGKRGTGDVIREGQATIANAALNFSPMPVPPPEHLLLWAAMEAHTVRS